MQRCKSVRIRRQIRFLHRQFLQDGELPFTDILSFEAISQALKTDGIMWKDRIYSQLVTLLVFKSQVLSADQLCKRAVACLIAHRLSHGKE